MLQKRFLFQINAVSVDLHINQIIRKKTPTKILNSTTVFITDNNKWVLGTKSEYYNDFWRIMLYWRL